MQHSVLMGHARNEASRCGAYVLFASTLFGCAWGGAWEDSAAFSDAPSQREADTAEVTAELTTQRIIPVRVVHTLPNWICAPDCPAFLTYEQIVKTVARANLNFQSAGIKFWVKSVEYVETGTLGHHATGTTQHNWSSVATDAQKLFPGAPIPLTAYEPTKALTSILWLEALTAVYAEKDLLHVFIEPGSGQSGAAYPHNGRNVVVLACNLMSDDCTGGAASYLLAHELGHYFGLPHTDGLDTLRKPSGGNWAAADQWDLIFCPTSHSATFYPTKASVTACAGYMTIGNRLGTSSTYCTTIPSETGITTCASGYWYFDPLGGGPYFGYRYYLTAGATELFGVTRDLGGTHNPPASYAYANNLMFPQRPESAHAAPTFLSDSQIIKVETFANQDITFEVDSQTNHKRLDGTYPSGAVPEPNKGKRPHLGQDNRDFIYWGNSTPSPAADFSFRGAYREVAGTGYRPVSGDFDNDGYDDILWYYPADKTARFWWGNAAGTFVGDNRSNFFAETGYSHILVGDFDGDGRDDLFAYVGGSKPDYIYWANASRAFSAAVHNVAGYYEPLVGQFNGTFGDDIYWYHAGDAIVHRWWSTGSRTAPFSSNNFYAVDAGGPFTPIVGDFDSNGQSDIFWYVAGPAQDRIWYHSGGTVLKYNATNVHSAYAPLSGDFDGDGHSDIFWDAQGLTTDSIWPGTSLSSQFKPSLSASAYGTFRPVAGDFNGDGRTDIFWYRGPY